MRVLAGLAVCTLVVTGCSEQEILRYQDRPAQTALECEAAYQAARKRGSSTYVNTSSGASLAGAAIGRGLAKGMVDSAYRSCLARVAQGASPATSVPVEVAGGKDYRQAITPQTPRPVACPAHAGVIYGGSQYCTGQ